ncbi:hypothetical protein GJ496_006673 [Pomphorhynchus laevis]|nr:hypothetical protein GJ496_006673 [Pomphorhynchus laevis]
MSKIRITDIVQPYNGSSDIESWLGYSVSRGINSAIKWGLTDILIRTYSCTVAAWLDSMINRTYRVKTKSAADMLIKRRLCVIQSVFWYYLAPTPGSEPETSPAERAFGYTWPHPSSRRCVSKDIVKSVYDVGDNVYVKPSNAKCTTRWNKGVITALISEQTAEVDGIPRHVTDIRPFNQVDKNE